MQHWLPSTRKRLQPFGTYWLLLAITNTTAENGDGSVGKKEASRSWPVSERALSEEEALDIVQHAKADEPGALGAIRQAVAQYPGVKACADVAYQAEASWINLVSDSSLFFKETLEERLAKLRKDLLGPSASPIERLLVERIVICWMQVNHADWRAADMERHGYSSFEQAVYFQERQGRAQRRYLAAVKALAQVRKLLVPVVQVNIAKKQTNVVAAGPVVPQATPAGGREGC
jgi:hypothetical protein